MYYNPATNTLAGVATFTGKANTAGNADTATRLQTARTIWGQSFNGQANISGDITGATSITGTNTNLIIKPGDSNVSRKAILRGNVELDQVDRGGGVVIGNAIGAEVEFRTRVSNGYRFYKPGVSTFNGVHGKFVFSGLTGVKTYTFPDWGGNIVVDSNSGGTKFNSDIVADSFVGRGTVFAAVRIKSYGSPITSKYEKRYNVSAVTFTATSTDEDAAVEIRITYTSGAPYRGNGIFESNKASNLVHSGCARSSSFYPGAFIVGPNGANSGDDSNGAGYAFYTANTSNSSNKRVNASLLEEVSLVVFNIEATSAQNSGTRTGTYNPPAFGPDITGT